MANFARRTEVLRYRQLVIDTISSAFPSAVTIAVVIASARIKIVRNVTLSEIECLLCELMTEGVLLKENDRYIFNKANADILQNNLAIENCVHLSDKEMRDMQRNETREAKRLRLIQRRVHTFLSRQAQFDSDVRTLNSLLPSFFTIDMLPKILPEEWQRDSRRNVSAYIAQCIIYLMGLNNVSRCEKTGRFKRI